MVRILKEPRVTRCVSMSYEFDVLCRENNISPSEALRIGVSVMLAERGVKEYDNNLNLYRKMIMYQKEVERLSNECNTLKEKINKSEDIIKVFG